MIKLGDRVQVHNGMLKTHGQRGIVIPGHSYSIQANVRLDNGINITINRCNLIAVHDNKVSLVSPFDYSGQAKENKLYVIFEFEDDDYLPRSVEELADIAVGDIPVDTWYGTLAGYIQSPEFNNMHREHHAYVAVSGDDIYHLTQSVQFTVEKAN